MAGEIALTILVVLGVVVGTLALLGFLASFIYFDHEWTPTATP